MEKTEAAPEETRLKERLFGTPGNAVRNIKVDWGPKAHLLTREERCGAINRVLDAIASGRRARLHFGDSNRKPVDTRVLSASLSGDGGTKV